MKIVFLPICESFLLRKFPTIQYIIQENPLHFHPPPHPGTMVVHFLTEAAREKYELEKLLTLRHHHDDQYQAMQKILEEQLTQ